MLTGFMNLHLLGFLRADMYNMDVYVVTAACTVSKRPPLRHNRSPALEVGPLVGLNLNRSSTRMSKELFRGADAHRESSPSSSSHSRSSDVPSSLVERVLVVKSQLHSVLGVTTFVSEGSPGDKDAVVTTRSGELRADALAPY